MNQYQTLSPFKLQALQADIHERVGLQRTMAEHTRPVLAMELGVSINTIVSIENGDTQNSRLPDETVKEIRRRRAVWANADEAMDGFTIQSLADSHGVCAKTIVNQIRKFRDESVQVMRGSAA